MASSDALGTRMTAAQILDDCKRIGLVVRLLFDQTTGETLIYLEDTTGKAPPSAYKAIEALVEDSVPEIIAELRSRLN